VFFQTDFPLLATAYEGIVGRSKAEVLTHSAFMAREAGEEIVKKTNTRSGYNPMKEDFKNISVLVGRRE
jgi:hypothetical protein